MAWGCLPINFVLEGCGSHVNEETNRVRRELLARDGGQIQTSEISVRWRRRGRGAHEPAARPIAAPQNDAASRERRHGGPLRGPSALHLRVRLRIRGVRNDLGRLPPLHAHAGLVAASTAVLTPARTGARGGRSARSRRRLSARRRLTRGPRPRADRDRTAPGAHDGRLASLSRSHSSPPRPRTCG